MPKFAGILDNIRSVHNVGSIFRTAEGAGFSKLYLCGITPSPVDRFGKTRGDFVKVSLGAEKTIEWETASSAPRAIRGLLKDGWKIFAVEQGEASAPYYSIEIKENGKYAFVIGSETRGVGKNALKLADKIIEIPMRGKKESLNVSIAFGIVAFLCARRGFL